MTPAGKRLSTRGQVGIVWACEPDKGGCGNVGTIPGHEAVQHWQKGGTVQCTCGCGMGISIKRPEPPRIVTPAQHAAQGRPRGR